MVRRASNACSKISLDRGPARPEGDPWLRVGVSARLLGDFLPVRSSSTARRRRAARARPAGRRRPPRRAPRRPSRARTSRRPRGHDSRGPVIAALVVLLALVAVGVQVLRSGPGVRTAVMPGSFTGYAFDACEAPSQQAMDAWWQGSPYAAVGIYIAGENRACPQQANLDAAWVATQAQRGWRLLPLSVGPQAPCTPEARWSRIDPSPADGYAAARAQGRDEAGGAVDAARDLALAPGSTLWLDVEAFDTSQPRCRAATLAYVSGWTVGLRRLGFVAGVYSSAGSGIRMLEQARGEGPTLPRRVWVADWNGRAAATTARRGGWQGVVHQYAGTHRETHGGVTLSIDSNFMRVGRGSVAPPERRRCPLPHGQPSLRAGDRSRAVAALQCLLRRRGLLHEQAGGRYDAATRRAVTGLQRRHGLRSDGATDRRTWAVLLASGSRPVLKYGAGSSAVRRLQRTLNAVQGAGLPVTGVYRDRTAAAVRRYQRSHGLPVTGVVSAAVWRALQTGR